METAKGTRLGIFTIGTILVLIVLKTLLSDLAVAQAQPAPVPVTDAPAAAAAPAPQPADAGSVPPSPPAMASAAAAPAAAPQPSANQLASQEVKKLVQSWRSAWAARDLDAYLAFYASDFQGNAATPEQWRTNRKRIIGQAKSIDIQIGDPEIKLQADDTATATFAIDYASDRFADHGTKILEVQRKNGQWLIAGEDFLAK